MKIAEGSLERLSRIEEKVDACLILLLKATTHDDFVYTHSDKSEPWNAAMRWADSVATKALSNIPK